MSQGASGKVIQVIGTVVDVEFPPDSLPDLLNALEMQIYQAMLELVASEQAARMVAMRNATENANEIVDDLTLELNKARQESITSELLDIVSGVAALAN